MHRVARCWTQVQGARDNILGLSFPLCRVVWPLYQHIMLFDPIVARGLVCPHNSTSCRVPLNEDVVLCRVVPPDLLPAHEPVGVHQGELVLQGHQGHLGTSYTSHTNYTNYTNYTS